MLWEKPRAGESSWRSPRGGGREYLQDEGVPEGAGVKGRARRAENTVCKGMDA